MSQPLVSVVISSKNGVQWLPRCFESLAAQTIFDELEVVVVDNCSTDETAELSRKELQKFPRATVIRNVKDVGYTGGIMVGTGVAVGEYLFILSDDTQIEPDCLEKMLQALAEAKADVAVPTLMEYDSMQIVHAAPMGFDIFGRATWSKSDHDLPGNWHDCFFIGGAGFLIRREVWRKLGGFDATHFMYGEDDDISWKIWLAGHRGIYVKNAILHHPTPRAWEIKEFTRYLVNRNTLLVLLKNAQHVLLLCWVTQVMMLAAESILMLFISRSWKFVWNCYLKAVIDCLKMWRHVLQMRRFIRTIRKRSDWWMLRKFFRLRPNRWDMVKTFFLEGHRPTVKPTK